MHLSGRSDFLSVPLCLCGAPGHFTWVAGVSSTRCVSLIPGLAGAGFWFPHLLTLYLTLFLIASCHLRAWSLRREVETWGGEGWAVHPASTTAPEAPHPTPPGKWSRVRTEGACLRSVSPQQCEMGWGVCRMRTLMTMFLLIESSDEACQVQSWTAGVTILALP